MVEWNVNAQLGLGPFNFKGTIGSGGGGGYGGGGGGQQPVRNYRPDSDSESSHDNKKKKRKKRAYPIRTSSLIGLVKALELEVTTTVNCRTSKEDISSTVVRTATNTTGFQRGMHQFEYYSRLMSEY